MNHTLKFFPSFSSFEESYVKLLVFFGEAKSTVLLFGSWKHSGWFYFSLLRKEPESAESSKGNPLLGAINQDNCLVWAVDSPWSLRGSVTSPAP